MNTDVLFLFILGVFLLLLCCLSNWLYVCMIAIVEVMWALVICMYTKLALDFFEVTLYFWGFSWLFVATVESIAGIFTFIAYSQLTGQAYL